MKWNSGWELACVQTEGKKESFIGFSVVLVDDDGHYVSRSFYNFKPGNFFLTNGPLNVFFVCVCVSGFTFISSLWQPSHLY